MLIHIIIIAIESIAIIIVIPFTVLVIVPGNGCFRIQNGIFIKQTAKTVVPVFDIIGVAARHRGNQGKLVSPFYQDSTGNILHRYQAFSGGINSTFDWHEGKLAGSGHDAQIKIHHLICQHLCVAAHGDTNIDIVTGIIYVLSGINGAVQV